MKKITPLFAILIAAVLAGCSSTKLTDTDGAGMPPVEDRNAAVADASPIVTSLTSASDVGLRGPSNVAHIIYFDFDSFIVKPEAAPVIEQHAKYLRSNPDKKLQLEGHTDERGGREYNLALGQKRAEAVAKAMALMGAKSDQTEGVSFGMEKPADTSKNEEGFSKNRRVEFIYR